MRSAVRISTAAYRASWGDSLEMTAQRHPSVDVVLHKLNGLSISPHLSSAMARLPGFAVLTWDEFVVGRRPPPRNIEDVELGTHGGGWQHEAAARMECDVRARMSHTRRTGASVVSITERTAAGTAFAVGPSYGLVRIESQLFRVLLLSLLAHMQMWPSTSCFAHRQVFWEDVVLHWRHAFAELQPNCSSETLTFLCHHGLPVFGGAQLVVDTTLVSALHCDGSARHGAAERRGCFG